MHTARADPVLFLRWKREFRRARCQPTRSSITFLAALCSLHMQRQTATSTLCAYIGCNSAVSLGGLSASESCHLKMLLLHVKHARSRAQCLWTLATSVEQHPSDLVI